MKIDIDTKLRYIDVDGRGILINEDIPIEPNDYYYFESEREHFIRQCKTIDRSKEYWLDDDIKWGIILGKILFAEKELNLNVPVLEI